jgi:carboxymethylenebutenolidase
MKSSIILLLITCGLTLATAIAGCTDAQQPDQIQQPAPVHGATISIMAGGKAYPAYLAVPSTPGKHPAIVLMHSFNGLEQGYKDMADAMAGEGFVVIAPEWQTYNQRAGDPEVEPVIWSSIAVLTGRQDVDTGKLGLTGFCAGGRYTMLFLPQISDFKAGVAWYGFPYNGGFTNNTTPAEHIPELGKPMLIIHGSRDHSSPVSGIYNYTKELDNAGKYYELKVYQGKPHGFMIVNGSLAKDDAGMDAYGEMMTFFRRMLV